MTTEADFQQQVVDLAKLLGWKWLHVRRSIGKGRRWVTATNVVGWPDLFLWHEQQQRVVALELKSETGVLASEQRDVLLSLERAGVPAFVVRPSHLDDGSLSALLGTPAPQGAA